MLIERVIKINEYFLVAGFKVEGTSISTIIASLGKEGWCKEHKVFNPENAEVQN